MWSFLWVIGRVWFKDGGVAAWEGGREGRRELDVRDGGRWG